MTTVMKNLKTYQAASYARRIFSDLVCPEDEDVTALEQLETLRGYLEGIPDINHAYHLSDAMKLKQAHALTNFERLVPLFENRTYDCLALYSLDRFASTVEETRYILLTLFPTLGVRILSYSEGYDSMASGDDKNGFPILAKLLNEAAARDAARRSKRRIQSRRLTGMHCPYGYLPAEDGSQNIYPDPESSPIVQRIFREYLSGRGFTEIAHGLTDDGIPTPTALKYRRGVRYKYGAPSDSWSNTTIIHILENSIHTGDLVLPTKRTTVYAAPEELKVIDTFPAQVVENHHEAIISHSDYETAQLMLAADRAASKPNTPRAQDCIPNPYRNLLRCSVCGAYMYYQPRRTTGGKKRMVYVCSAGWKKGSGVCSRRATPYLDVDAQIREAIQAEIDLAGRAKERLAATSSSSSDAEETRLKRQMEKLIAEVREITLASSRLLSEFRSGAFSTEEYYLRKAGLDADSAGKSLELKSTMDQLREYRTAHTPENNPWLRLYHGYKLPEQMTLAVSRELIELATLSPEGKVTVTLKHGEYKEKLLANLHLDSSGSTFPEQSKAEATA